MTNDGHIHELSVVLGSAWTHTDLMTQIVPPAPPAPPAVPGGSISGFAFEKQGSKQVIYTTSDGHIHELSIVLGSAWTHTDLMTQIVPPAPPAPPAVTGALISGFAFEALASKQVVYMTNDGHIHELSIVLADLKWSHADLMTQAVPPAPPATDF